ncbi:fatty acid-binding protein, brain [Ictalurus punctatus]|uniref:Fatty acid-binding protein, brain n=1 Tax=Ictalurus punctatus TaxID=7998 RepID=A0A2D0Q447_ICTPU|nr:fatty acid-binding protein, brain [Ictalurus punctatus]
MEVFFGTWKLVKKVNFDEYLIAMGILQDLNNDTIKPTDTFHRDGEHVVLTIKNSHFTRDVRFKLNEEFFEDTKDGRLCHSVISLKGGQLVQVQKWDGKETTIVREIKGSNMIMTLKFNGVQGMRIYEKV